MPMASSPVRRSFALVALAVCLLAALPCGAAVAGGDACCGADANCADASGAPCAQLAGTPCCTAQQPPLAARHAPELPPFSPIAAQHARHGDPWLVTDPLVRRLAPAALQAHFTIRAVVLRL